MKEYFLQVKLWHVSFAMKVISNNAKTPVLAFISILQKFKIRSNIWQVENFFLPLVKKVKQ